MILPTSSALSIFQLKEIENFCEAAIGFIIDFSSSIMIFD